MNPISVDVMSCAKCGISAKDVTFLKDKFGAPIYFHMLNKDKAVLFCSAQHSSDWAKENKEKIWDRKS